MVASAIISHYLDLDKIHGLLSETEYDPDQFPALLYQKTYPKFTMMLFNNGKMICTGLNGVEITEDAIYDFIEKLRGGSSFLMDNIKIEIQSIIASAELGKRVTLKEVYNNSTLSNAELAPDGLDALIYRPSMEGMTCLIFPSGKIAFSGAKDIHQVERVYADLKEKL